MSEELTSRVIRLLKLAELSLETKDMSWSLDYARDPGRVASLVRLNAGVTTRFDGTTPAGSPLIIQVPPRVVLAGARFTGGPGREQEAAEAWAFEMKAYFHRGVGEQPRVEYAHGTYSVTGLITTTHPGDRPDASGIVWFT